MCLFNHPCCALIWMFFKLRSEYNILKVQRFCRYYIENIKKSFLLLTNKWYIIVVVLVLVWHSDLGLFSCDFIVCTECFFSVRWDNEFASLKRINLVIAISLARWWFYMFFYSRDVISALLDTMENLKGVLQLQKNACLTLCNFKIPMEVVCIFWFVIYDRLKV